MFSQNFIMSVVDGLVLFATDLLIPFMVTIFVIAIGLRALIYFTVKREDWFAREFEKRVHAFIDDDEQKNIDSFYEATKRLMEKTYYELFEMRSIMQRRKPDYIMAIGDRLFFIQQGCALLVKDTLRQIRYLKYGNFKPKMLEMSKKVFQNNAAFKRALGIFPTGPFNDVLNILPGIFIIGGIFGTFLGIMKALPELGTMDLTDVEGTKQVMDLFLLKISFSMSTSIVGIILSVLMSFINTSLSPEKLFVDTVERFENTLDILWNQSKHNEISPEVGKFDETKDATVALAEEALRREIERAENNKLLNRGQKLAS